MLRFRIIVTTWTALRVLSHSPALSYRDAPFRSRFNGACITNSFTADHSALLSSLARLPSGRNHRGELLVQIRTGSECVKLPCQVFEACPEGQSSSSGIKLLALIRDLLSGDTFDTCISETANDDDPSGYACEYIINITPYTYIYINI